MNIYTLIYSTLFVFIEKFQSLHLKTQAFYVYKVLDFRSYNKDVNFALCYVLLSLNGRIMCSFLKLYVHILKNNK